MHGRVVIVGAGLAGLAACTELAPRGAQVTLLEARSRAGGRAGSFTDAQTGQLVDACQHVSMGCCTNLAHLARRVGIDHLLRPQPTLYFMTADRRVSPFVADSLPPPLHLARAFLRAHYLSPKEKLSVASGLARLRLADDSRDQPFADWLASHGQTPRVVERFWGVVLTSALNESIDRVGLRYARKVFLDGFLRHRRGHVVEVPAVPLGRLYGDELHAWLARHRVDLRFNSAVKAIGVHDGRVERLELRDGSAVEADWYVSAVPFDRLLDLLPPEVVASHAAFSNLRRLETSPITSVHLWFDRPVLIAAGSGSARPLPHVVLIGCLGQWVFSRGEVAAGEHYLQVVVSAARQFRGLGHEETRRRVLEELKGLFPVAAEATLLRGRVVTEHHATFSAVPGVDRWRPRQGSPLPNLLLAGDWTATGWPATMEGAVRSGYLAAEALLARHGTPARILRPDL